MKSDLMQLLNGKTLKSQIYRTISSNKFSNMSHLLKNNVKKQVKYTDYKTQVTQVNAQSQRDKLKCVKSAKKLSQSIDDSSVDKSKSKRSLQKNIFNGFQRSQRRLKAVSQTQAIRNKEYLLSNSQKSSKERKNRVVKSKNGKQLGQTKSKQKNNEHIFQSNNSKSKTFSKVHLQSILQKSSSEEIMIITPENKKLEDKSQAKLISGSQKTKKKEKKGHLSVQLRKKIQKSFISPQKFISLLKNDYLTVNFRVLKKKLIQIEIYIIKNISQLKVNLIKGNIQCQKIQQNYTKLTSKTLFTLFSSVREVDIFDAFNFPKLHLQLSLTQQNRYQYFTILPYTWLHNMQQTEQTISKKSRIKTRLCLQKLPINPKKLKILSNIFHRWIKKGYKDQSQFETCFKYKQSQFQIKLKQEGQTFSLELQGKGQQKLTNMIDFFSKIIL